MLLRLDACLAGLLGSSSLDHSGGRPHALGLLRPGAGFALGGFHCVGGIQQDPSEFRPEPLTISFGLNALRYVVDRSPGRPLSARANIPTTAIPFYLIFCALAPIVATHQERSGTLTNLPHCGKVVSTKVGWGRFDGKGSRVAPALAVTGGFDDGADP